MPTPSLAFMCPRGQGLDQRTNCAFQRRASTAQSIFLSTRYSNGFDLGANHIETLFLHFSPHDLHQNILFLNLIPTRSTDALCASESLYFCLLYFRPKSCEINCCFVPPGGPYYVRPSPARQFPPRFLERVRSVRL